MNEGEVIQIEKDHMAGVYAKKNLVITKGNGAILWDINGLEYIDCMGSYGVAIVGHCHPRVVEAIKHQSETLTSCHGSLYNDSRSRLLERLFQITPSGLDSAFLSNSGAEAVECAIKLARKQTGKKELIAMMGGYHGKTMGALSATWEKRYREPFLPLVPGFKHVPYGNLEKLRDAVTEETAGILVEPIQGEGGVKVPPEGYLKGVRELCDERGVLMIADEVQTGFGRTGRIFACEHSGVVPDIMCLAKAVGGGLPIGITIAKKEVMSSLKIGEHSTTFGGNPLTCAAASAAIDVLVTERLAERAAELGAHFMKMLEKLKSEYSIVREVRGVGLMIGVETRFDVFSILQRLLGYRIIALDAGRNIIRFLPPLVISREQLDTVANSLNKVLAEEEDERLRGSA
ncbi:aspartate aminotransferase family protein, partial [Candidatus Bathyarchaeota archaeon]|nr:aspartate aminotransferase family protein [Candidatus Bathyarchaeota archaeon]